MQNEIIYLVSNSIKLNKLEMIKEVKYYSTILDCTPNISLTEGMILITHFVFIDLINKELNVKKFKVFPHILYIRKVVQG